MSRGTVKPYTPIGMNPENGDYVVPKGETGGRAWWKRQVFTVKVSNGGKDLVVRHVIPMNDRDGSRQSFTRTKDGAPVLNYNAANNLKKALYYRQDPVTALLAHIDLDRVTIEWLRQAGVPEHRLPNVNSSSKNAELESYRKLRERGVELPDDIIQELDLADGRQAEYKAQQQAMVRALAQAEATGDDIEDDKPMTEEAEDDSEQRLLEAEEEAAELRAKIADLEREKASLQRRVLTTKSEPAPAPPAPVEVDEDQEELDEGDEIFDDEDEIESDLDDELAKIEAELDGEEEDES